MRFAIVSLNGFRTNACFARPFVGAQEKLARAFLLCFAIDLASFHSRIDKLFLSCQYISIVMTKTLVLFRSPSGCVQQNIQNIWPRYSPPQRPSLEYYHKTAYFRFSSKRASFFFIRLRIFCWDQCCATYAYLYAIISSLCFHVRGVYAKLTNDGR